MNDYSILRKYTLYFATYQKKKKRINMSIAGGKAEFHVRCGLISKK